MDGITSVTPGGAASPDTEDAVREAAERGLRSLAGPQARLRADQWTAIKALVVDRRRALVVQRTGWGKSAVYFVAAALLRERGAGPTVIVSPLLALMRNQIAAAERAGIRARTINSANIEDWEAIYADIGADAVDVLLVSPERLNNPDFRDLILPKLADSAGMIVIDEAHCISDWGHDFRPDYRRLRGVVAGLAPDVPVLATTATANTRVMRDVAEQLGSGWHGPGEPPPTLVLRGPLDRVSLRLGVLRLPVAAQRLAWLADQLGELPGSGIIYTLTVAGAHDVAEFLRDRGYPVEAYTGQTDPAHRLAVEDGLLANAFKAVVATSALGMGFDKPDLGFIIHLGAPQSPVAYYQQDHLGAVHAAARAADLLVVGHGRLRGAQVDDEAEVGLVVAHAERAGRHDRLELVRQEILLHGEPLRRLGLPGVGLGGVPAVPQELRDIMGGGDGQCVDDAGAGQLAELLGQPGQPLRRGGAGRYPGPDDQLLQHRGLGRDRR